MLKSIISRLIPILLIGVLTTYLAMSLTARRLILPGEYVIFTNAILRATFGHADEAGGMRALEYTQAALAYPLPSDQVSGPPALLTIPLPPHTIRHPNPANAFGNYYVSFVSDAELIAYITETMPQAGWRHTDQMGASHFFRNGSQQLVVSQRYLLSSAIRELHVMAYP
jgi:hypothetical protein